MNFSRFPNWVWFACAAATLLVIVPALFGTGTGQAPKPKTFVSVYGETVAYLEDHVFWVTGKPTSYLIVMPVSKSDDEGDRNTEADKLFVNFAGPYANDLGFQRVVIRSDDGSRPGEINILGFKLSFRASVGAGPLPQSDLEDGIIYEKHADGTWSRDDFETDAPEHVENVSVPTGAKFALSYSMEDFPSGWFVYECISCNSQNVSKLLAVNLYPLLHAASLRADHDHLTKLSVAIFGGDRKSTWQFPPLLHISMVKRKGGQWIAPKATEQQVEASISQYVQKMRLRGAALRHEKS